MKKILLLILSLTFILTAQTKKFTADDIILNAVTSLRVNNPTNVFWIDSNDFSFVKKTDDEYILYRASTDNDKVDQVLTLTQFNDILTKADLAKYPYFPSYSWENGKLILWVHNVKLSVNPVTREFKKMFILEDDAENLEESPNKLHTAYTVGNSLFMDTYNKRKMLAKSDDDGIVYGQSVHRNEFAISKGLFWSPTSEKLAFYRKDETMVDNYPVVDYKPVPAKLAAIKYPMAGRASHHVTIGVYDVKSERTVYLNTGEPKEQYLTAVTWDPSGDYIYVGHLNRDQNHLVLKKYNVSTGDAVKTVFEEKQDKYVEPEHDLIFLPNGPNKFLWLSERDGYLHYHMYTTDGEYVKQVTTAKAPVIEHLGFSADGNSVIYVSNVDDPKSQKVYRTNIETGETKVLTEADGVHHVTFNFKNDYFIDVFENVTTPGITKVYNNNATEIKVIDTAQNPYTEYQMCKVEFGTFQHDGTSFETRTVYPPNFNASKKYPVVVYVYGGPHVQLVVNEFPKYRYHLWFQQMAQLGYVVFTVDSRGSGNRGRDFEQATFRRLGTIEMEDQLAGLDYLKSKGFVDENRIGVFGWSYGGFMATTLMTRTNNTFKVGVAGGTVIDWNLYEVMYTERYMDTPEQNPEGYKEACLLNYAQNLEGKLLMLHGTSDPTVVWQNSLKFAKKCSDLLIPLDYYPYVGHPHGVTGMNAVHMYQKITQYFIDNL